MTRQLQHNWCSDSVLRDAKELLKRAGNENTEWGIRIQALNDLSKMLEVEESKYEEVTGDVMVNMRSQQPIGTLLSAVKEEEEIYDEIYESWIHDRHAGMEQRVAAMRFFLACLSAWQFQSPLTEPDFVTGLQEWATTEVEKPSRSGTCERPDEESCLLEARRTYATGLLAIALTRTEVCDEAVRSGTVARMVQDLERMALGDCDSEDAVQLLASSSTCDIVAAGSQQLTRVTEVTQEQASSNPGQHCEGWEELRARRQRYVVQCLGSFGEYMECLALVLAADGVGVVKRLLHAWRDKPILLADLLRLLVALLVHRRFAELFVESGGVQLLLSLPRNKHTFVGLSFAFFGLASVPLAVERVCALPTEVVEELVERALSLLTCGYDPARKNVALFFGAALHFRGILDVFDRAGGLPRLLDAMRTVLLLLRAPAHGENRTEKQARPHSLPCP
ncbi:probable DDB1- and CUL4-associated factor 1 at C-terminar half [Coccomyxa sp. Obi]|nr:probable DDB1- and CUL4-associated factor 1 at C-terminar half [Coccomyxa sp. Obi]